MQSIDHAAFAEVLLFSCFCLLFRLLPKYLLYLSPLWPCDSAVSVCSHIQHKLLILTIESLHGLVLPYLFPLISSLWLPMTFGLLLSLAIQASPILSRDCALSSGLLPVPGAASSNTYAVPALFLRYLWHSGTDLNMDPFWLSVFSTLVWSPLFPLVCFCWILHCKLFIVGACTVFYSL